MEHVFEIERLMPCRALRDYIDTYYLLSVHASHDTIIHEQMLPEMPNMRWQLSGDWSVNVAKQGYQGIPQPSLFGFTHAPYDIQVSGGARLFGAGLKPLGWQALIGTPADALADAVAPLSSYVAPDLGTITVKLMDAPTPLDMAMTLDAFFLGELKPVARHTQWRLAAIEACLARKDVAGGLKVAEMADELGLSIRQLERWCRKLFGCAPKLLLRKHRFMSMLSRHGQTATAQAWLDTADESFYDQSHYIREYRRFTGKSPREYAAKGNHLQRVVAETYRDIKGPQSSTLALSLEAGQALMRA